MGGLPIELTSFTAEKAGDDVRLEWQTASEINNYGFSIEARFDSKGEWESIGFVQGAGNSNSPKYYSFVHSAIKEEAVKYRLKQIDNDGQFSYSNEIEVSSTLDRKSVV